LPITIQKLKIDVKLGLISCTTHPFLTSYGWPTIHYTNHIISLFSTPSIL
jgi:hypothetical protein